MNGLMPNMTKPTKLTIAIGAAGVTLVVAGLGAAGAVGASWVLSPSEDSKAVIDDAASQLGVEPSELSDALKQALKNRVDEAVEDGRLTEEQANELEVRIDANEFPLLGALGFHGYEMHGGPGPGRLGLFGHFELFETAASYLGLTEAQLREELRDATLAEIARERGKSVEGLVQQLVATQTKRIDEAVAEGRISEEQAANLEAELGERTEALVNGEWRMRGDEPRRRFWPGSGSPRAPPSFGGPPA
jgi:polyhydroxyalkanoate synthesis regulator phasin